MPVKLKKLNLKKGDGHDHPDVNLKANYLAKINDCWYAGQFERQWYGLNFDDGYGMGVGHQYDKPGTNSSGWQELYEIKQE
jgi:hypothetical protein